MAETSGEAAATIAETSGEAEATMAETLVERFDIELFSDLSAK